MRLLLVEDDNLLGDGIQAGLRQAGYAVNWVKDGRSAALALETEDYAAIVLDLGLPGMSGLDVLKRLRQHGKKAPVLVLTARDTVIDKIKGLDAGADDYVIKPFDLNELTARLRALIRRSGGRADPVLRHGALVLDPAAHTLTRSGQVVDLSQREFAILQELLENRGKVLSREKLEERLYGWGDEVESNAVEVHIHHLRRKLGTELIRTVRGIGYMVGK